MDEDIFAQARAEAHEDLERAGIMTEDELEYLDRMGELSDPETDGLECDHGMQEFADGG